MGNLGRDWMVGRASSSGVRVLLLPAVLLLIQASLVRSEPITFRFTSTITGVFAGNPFDLPMSLHEGDEIQGKFTFDPTIGVPFADNAFDSKQPYALEFNINGTTFGSSQYGIRVVNHTPHDPSVPIEVFDGLTLACSPSSLLPCMPTIIDIPGGDPFSFGASLHMSGDGSVLSAPNLSADADVWNSFVSERRLSLSFRNQGIGSATLFATVGPFLAIPEPATSGLVSTLVCCIGVSSVTRSARRDERRINATTNRRCVCKSFLKS